MAGTFYPLEFFWTLINCWVYYKITVPPFFASLVCSIWRKYFFCVAALKHSESEYKDHVKLCHASISIMKLLIFLFALGKNNDSYPILEEFYISSMASTGFYMSEGCLFGPPRTTTVATTLTTATTASTTTATTTTGTSTTTSTTQSQSTDSNGVYQV